MIRKLVSLAAVTVMVLMLIPAALAEGWTMYVYTDNGKSLNVRREPAMGENVMYTLQYGQEVTVLNLYGSGWARVEDWVAGDRYVGYVQSRFLVYDKPASRGSSGGTVPVTPDTDAAKTLASMNAEFRSARSVVPFTVVARPSRPTGWVNLRWAPTTEAERITTCPQGKELTVLAELKNWYQVQDPVTGMIGFISRQYVTRR